MIIAKQNSELLVIGEKVESKQATISAEERAKLQYILTKGLYKDPITAVIAEWTNNGVDSVIQAKKDVIENPVLVKIEKNNLNQYMFSVEDKGQGLDERDFEDVCMNYLKSTKEQSVEAIGCYGIGMKSFLALDRPATFTCRKNGKEIKYFVYQGEEFVNYTLLSTGVTKEENGVKAELMLSGWEERNEFIVKAKQKLAYYDTAVLLIDGNIVANSITRNNLFQYSSLNANWDMHLCLKDVYYTIDWTDLGVRPINIPIALRFELTDGITPTPSRESYITNEKTKKIILKRLGEVATWFSERYNEAVKEFPSFAKAFDHLGTPTYSVEVKGSDGKVKSFAINQLVSFSSLPLINPKVKGMVLTDPVRMKSQRSYMFYEWDIVGFMSNATTFKTKSHYTTIEAQTLQYGKRPIIVGPLFAGNVKTYLKEKYGADSIFVRKNTAVRKLRSTTTTNWDSWYGILDLVKVAKADWKFHIKEWEEVVKTVTDTFIDETNVENDKLYIKWLEDRKKKQMEDRAAGIIKADYKGLNKKDGDVTLAYARPSVVGQTVVFEKKAFKISDMEYPHFKTVILKETDDLEQAKAIISIFKGDKVRFAVVGPREVLKLPQSPQYIDMEKFKSISCKPFGRLASAITFNKVVEEFDRLTRTHNGVFKKCITSLVNDRNTLDEYVKKNLLSTGASAVQGYITTVADTKDLYDKSLWDVYLRMKEGLKKYEFVAMLKEPNSWDTHEQKRYVKFIRQQLVFRQKFYKDVDETILKDLNK